MITKIRTKGSSCTSMLSPPNDGRLWANAGVTNIVCPLCHCGHALFCLLAAVSVAEIGADYSGRRPNCNAALARIAAAMQRRTAGISAIGGKPTGIALAHRGKGKCVNRCFRDTLAAPPAPR